MIRALIVVLGLSLAGLPAMGEAQDAGGRPAAKSRNKAKAAPKQAPKSKRTSKGSGKSKSTPATAAAPAKPPPPPRERTERTERTEGAAPSTGDAAALADAEEDVRKEGGSEIKTVEFGGLDIEGQLKTPQMLYFLNRLRAEFSRPELPHRSFIPELQRGTKESAF